MPPHYVATDTPLPEGLARHDATALEWRTFVRAGHPAIAKWRPRAWSRWHHVQLLVDERIKGRSWLQRRLRAARATSRRAS